jgi:SAM-dependent methyltransferase
MSKSYSCGRAACAITESGEAVTDISHPFIRCPNCTTLRIPDEQVAHWEVPPDASLRVPLSMRVFFRMRRAWLNRVLPELADKAARILDVGCGDGQLLQFLGGQGYGHCRGIEVNPARAANARKRGLTVHGDLAAAAADSPDGYDIIFLWHVLEHVEQPMAFLDAIIGLLAEGGVLVVSVPNHDSIQTRLLGRWSSLPDYGRHLWFHPAGYGRWLAGALPGYRVEDLPNYNLEYELFGWVDSLASATARRINFVHQTLKKGEGGLLTRLGGLALAGLYLLPGLILSGLSLAVPGRQNTLNWAIRRTGG